MRWWGPLVLLAGVRAAIPLAAIAHEGSRVPGMPLFVRPRGDGGLIGDATGFYAATRELMAAWGRVPRPLLGLAGLLVVAALAALLLMRRRPAWRPWLAPAGLCAAGLAVSIGVHRMEPTGAAVLGWSLVWTVPLAAYRAATGGLTPAVAWDVGVALSVVFVALTVVAVAYLGRHATGSRRLGLLAAACWTAWPLLVRPIAGDRAWANAQWLVDVGLHNYGEPLSTLLVTAAAAVLLAPRTTALQLSLAGCALSLATLVKLSNALVAAVALAVVLLRDRVRGALPFAAGALALAPLVLVYWPKSYPTLYDNPRSWPRDPFDAAHVVTSWTHSSIFSPHTLAIVVPPAVLGLFRVLRPWPLALVAGLLLVNPVFYSFYANTAQHPRFLYASLPELFVLWAAAAGLVAQLAAGGLSSVGSRRGVARAPAD